MNLLAAALAQLLHIALMLAVAPLLPNLRQSIEALWAGRTAPSLLQPWRDLRRLARKQLVLAETASPLSRAVPAFCLGATALAAALVPSFTLGLALAPLSDLLVVLASLAAARLALALAALEPGVALAGVEAARLARLGCLAMPAVLLALLALGVLGGTTNLDLLAGLAQQGMLRPVAATALASAGLAGVALAIPAPSGLTAEFSGRDLAMLDFAEALRQLVWLDVMADLVLPFGMAEPGAGVLAWMSGLLAWVAKLALLTAGLTALRVLAGDLRPAHAPQILAVATVLGLLAALLVLSSTVAA